MLTREMLGVLHEWLDRLEVDLSKLESYEDSLIDRHRLEAEALRAALDTLEKLPTNAHRSQNLSPTRSTTKTCRTL